MERITGSEALVKALICEGTETVFGYPGGQIMPVFDTLYGNSELRHVLVRHEQGAVHAAQGFARATGKTGVVIVTSGPGATNVITGVADAMVDSTPVVVITGQVPNAMLGTDAFQETDVLGLTIPITKWSYQIRRAEDVAPAVARAFYIASTGRPGPVVLDFTKDAQVGLTEFEYSRCSFIRTYIPEPEPDKALIDRAAELIDSAERPMCVFGHGVILGNAEKELAEFLEKGGIPAGSTMLGLSALPSDFPHYHGMLGMHGNVAPNIKTNECDVLIAVGMRFDDRVTGNVATYARQAKIIHIDIDPTEVEKIIPVEVGIIGNAKKVLAALTGKIRRADRSEWEKSFGTCRMIEERKVISPETAPGEGCIRMGEVVAEVSRQSGSGAVIVTDVGQNQLIATRYSTFRETRSMITSGGLGTMGYGLPAAIGAKIAVPHRTVCLFVGDGGIQMTLQELGTIMQEETGVKIIILNNNWLGNVRQWQEMFFGKRYSQTRMVNPDYVKIAEAYGIEALRVKERDELAPAVRRMLSDDRPFILDVNVMEMGMVMPMIAPGKSLTDILLSDGESYNEAAAEMGIAGNREDK